MYNTIHHCSVQKATQRQNDKKENKKRKEDKDGDKELFTKMHMHRLYRKSIKERNVSW